MIEKALSGLVIMIVVIAFIFLYLFPVHGINRSKHKAVGMIIMTLWLIYPDICHVIFSSLSCINPAAGSKEPTPIEAVSRLYRDLATECWEGDHLYYIIYITIPGLIFWVIGLPAGLYYCLRANEANLKPWNPNKECPRYISDQ